MSIPWDMKINHAQGKELFAIIESAINESDIFFLVRNVDDELSPIVKFELQVASKRGLPIFDVRMDSDLQNLEDDFWSSVYVVDGVYEDVCESVFRWQLSSRGHKHNISPQDNVDCYNFNYNQNEEIENLEFPKRRSYKIKTIEREFQSSPVISLTYGKVSDYAGETHEFSCRLCQESIEVLIDRTIVNGLGEGPLDRLGARLAKCKRSRSRCCMMIT